MDALERHLLTCMLVLEILGMWLSLGIIMQTYIISEMSDVFHNLQGCVIMLHLACITPKYRSTSLRAES